MHRWRGQKVDQHNWRKSEKRDLYPEGIKPIPQTRDGSSLPGQFEPELNHTPQHWTRARVDEERKLFFFSAFRECCEYA